MHILFLITLLFMQTLFATLLKETGPNGLWLEIELNDDGDVSKLTFSDQGSIEYCYIDRRIAQITRYNSVGEELYKHTYQWEGDLLISETGWFTTSYIYDQNRRVIAKISPWQQDIIEYSNGQIVRLNEKIYTYDNRGQITSESGGFFATYDDQFNLLTLNGISLSSTTEKKHLDCVYDDYGRRTKKGDVSYLYLGFEELCSYTNGRCESLKVPGLSGMIAIEIDGKPYAPVIDPVGIVRKLIDPITNSVCSEINCDIFGANLSDAIPYAYRGKRFDSETGLIYFGRRYYDPLQHRWTSPDPLGPIDHENLYQCVYNNPLQFRDPTGCSFWGYVVGFGEIATGCAIIAGGATLELVTLGGFTIGLGVTTSAGVALISHGLIQTTYNAQDIEPPSWTNTASKNDPGCPQSREVQDKQFEDAVKEIEKQLGKRLSDKERRKLHDHISGQNYGYHEIVEEGYWLFND